MLFWCANLSRQNNAEILPNIKTPIRSIQINLASAYVIHTNQIMTSQGTLSCARHHTDINSLHWYFPKVFIVSDGVQFVFLGVVNAHSLTNYNKIELTFCWLTTPVSTIEQQSALIFIDNTIVKIYRLLIECTSYW